MLFAILLYNNTLSTSTTHTGAPSISPINEASHEDSEDQKASGGERYPSNPRIQVGKHDAESNAVNINPRIQVGKPNTEINAVNMGYWGTS